jgi:hypothetical protein
METDITFSAVPVAAINDFCLAKQEQYVLFLQQNSLGNTAAARKAFVKHSMGQFFRSTVRQYRVGTALSAAEQTILNDPANDTTIS